MKKLICLFLTVVMLTTVGFASGDQAIKPVEADASQYASGTKDTYILRDEARFRERIGEGTYWVPMNALGRGEYTDTEIFELAKTRDPEVIQAAIHTVYDAYQYFYLTNVKFSQDMYQRVVMNGAIWEVHQPGRTALLTNEGNCSALASLLCYLLEDDYDEIGYFMSYSLEESGHAVNYIKDGDRLYFLDMSSMSHAMVERIRSCDCVNYMGNLIMATSMDRYIEYYREIVQPSAVLFFTSNGDAVPPICAIRGDEGVHLKVSGEDSFHLIRNDDPEHLSVEQVSEETPVGEWEIRKELQFHSDYSFDEPVLIPDLQYGMYVATGIRSYRVHLRTGGHHFEITRMVRVYKDSELNMVKSDAFEGEEIENILHSRIRFPGTENELLWGDVVTDPKIASVELAVYGRDALDKEWMVEKNLDLSGYSTGFKEDSLTEGFYDYENIRENAAFEIPVGQGVDWVPLNALGKPNSDFSNFRRDQEMEDMQAEIDSLYEAVVAIKEMDVKIYEPNRWRDMDESHWHFFGGASTAFEEEYIHPATLVGLVNYWLIDDYEEVGVVFYAWPDGKMHMTNYFREDGNLYYVDLVGYLNQMNWYASETGRIEDYFDQSLLGNLYIAKNETYYRDYIQAGSMMRAPVMVQYPFEVALPITRYENSLGLKLVIAVNFENLVNPGRGVRIHDLYDDPGDEFYCRPGDLPMEYPEGWLKYFEN